MGVQLTDDALLRLFDRMREAIDSERNQRNAAAWRAPSGSGQSPDGALRVFLGASYMSRALGVDMREYYRDPALFLSANLRLSLLQFERFEDDVALEKRIHWHPGVVMEPSLFGVQARYAADKEPWEPHEYPLRCVEDLERLESPDFFENPAMREIHRMYAALRELLDRLAPDFGVTFPGWRRSPFAVACCLRGMEQLCFDFFDEPDFVHGLMSFLTESRIRWDQARTAFVEERDVFTLGNDEVNSPMLSPALYGEFVLPYERQLLAYHGELSYFHSCGCLTPLIPQIKTLRPRLFHVSPWTDLEAACDAFSGTGTALDVWAHVTEDVMYADERTAREAMARRIRICRDSGVSGFQFNSGNMQAVHETASADDEKIMQWVRASRAALEGRE